MEIPSFVIILNTCKRTEHPPNPKRKEVSKIDDTEFVLKKSEDDFTPFVSSIKPENSDLEKYSGIPSFS